MCCVLREVMLVVVAVVVSLDTDLPFTAASSRQVVACVASTSVCQARDIFTDAGSPLSSLPVTGAVSALQHLVKLP